MIELRRAPARTAGGAAVVLLGAAVLLAGVAAWHLTQGTSGVALPSPEVLWGSRVPRLAAGVAVGIALGVAGALFQSIARNALASPDTLAVTAGSHLALTVVAAFGLAIPLYASGLVAVVGGLAAAGLVLAIAGGGGSSTTRLILAGSAVMLGLQAGANALLLLFAQDTAGLYAWGNGSLSQLGLQAFLQASPVIGVAVLGALALSRRLDLLALGDDTAGSLGVPVRSTRVIGVLLAVVLTAAAVTLAGPIGFVGLGAPVIARLLARVVPVLHRHLVLLPVSGLLGAIIIVGADAIMRAVLGADVAILIPTGVATTLLGAVLLIVLARQSRDAGPTRRPPGAGVGIRSRTRAVVTGAVAGLVVAAVLVGGHLLGSTQLLLGDIALWLQGEAPPVVAFALDERSPRVLAAVVAGGAIALAGALVQAVSRNPLAEPGLLGITSGAGLAGALVVTTVAGGALLVPAAMLGALIAFALVYGISWRGGLDSDRLVLVGIGMWFALASLTAFVLLRSDPWNTPRLLTWLSGTTYGRAFGDVVPVAVALAVGLAIALVMRRDLDLLAVDDDTPRLAGVRLERSRLGLLVLAALLAAVSVTAIGVLGFVGLVAPHLARALVGGRHARSIPVAVLLGAALVGIADTVGRTVIAPAQLPAGLLVALLGAPYFVLLLARSRVGVR